MSVREGKWKCTYCAAVNRGRDMACAGCNATREADVQFFLEDDAPEVTDADLQRLAQNGPDWICETCGASSRATLAACGQCGAPRGSSAQRKEEFIPADAASDDEPAATNAEALRARSAALRHNSNAATGAHAPFNLSRRWKIGLIAGGASVFVVGLLLLVALTGLAVWASQERDAELVVNGLEWRRSVEVEELQTLTEQAWANELPTGARAVSRRREIHHTNKVQAGTKPVTETYTERVQTGTRRVKTGTIDRGNGFFEDVYKNEPVYRDERRTRTVQQPVYRDVPVYQDRVTYTIDRWRTVRAAETRGTDNAPRWADVPIDAKRRTGKRTGVYLVRVRNEADGASYEREVSEEEFTRFRAGATCRGRINNVGTLVELSPPL